MIERKYRIENNKLVRRSDGVPLPDDEPVFILRAQDKNALPALVAYNAICLNLNHKANVTKSIGDFKDFAGKNPERMKEPDGWKDRMNGVSRKTSTRDCISSPEKPVNRLALASIFHPSLLSHHPPPAMGHGRLMSHLLFIAG